MLQPDLIDMDMIPAKCTTPAVLHACHTAARGDMSKQLRSNPGKTTSPARENLTRACNTEPISLVRVGATTLA